ncbi:MAG: amidohydrolase [Christensenellales bacterium]|jgi:amidohydrolase
MSDFAFLARLQEGIAPYRQPMFRALDAIWKHPETGFREWFAHEYLKNSFEEMGYTLTEAGNIPGFYADVDTGREGPTVLLMGELDSVICPAHPDADPQTGAVHACGHCAQAASLIGIAGLFRDGSLLRGLSGKVRIMAVPAEELLEIGYREELRKKGIIRYLGGKVEFLHRGMMDGVDIAMMVHTAGGRGMGIPDGGNGCIAKTITYKGKAAHAGGAPHDGINALYAASLGMQAANSLRETFRDGDHIRFHPIITGNGGAVNVIPDKAVLESYVRGATLEAIAEANAKINRALAASAAAIGAQVHLRDLPGYMPVAVDPELARLTTEMMRQVVGDSGPVTAGGYWDTGCTDMGDMSAVMPAIQPYCGGAAGTGHGTDYRIVDPEEAVVRPAVFLAAMTCALLEKEAGAARSVLENASPRFAAKEDYFRAIDSLSLDTDAVTYREDGSVGLLEKT